MGEGFQVHNKGKESADDEHGGAYHLETRANYISRLLEVHRVPPDLSE